jgi:prolyl-tRNA synthetase
LSTDPSFIFHLGLNFWGKVDGFYPTAIGDADWLYCPACGFAAPLGLAPVKKTVFAADEAPAPTEKVLTPDCPTIESLAAFLGLSPQKTAKALMLVRTSRTPKSPDFGAPDFVFVVIRGDQTLSEAKLAALVGDFRLATETEIRAVKAVPGYASPVGVQNALIVVDDLIPVSPNLVAGANEAGYHLKNVNCGRDYQPDLVADLTLAAAGDLCATCGGPLEASRGWVLAFGGVYDFEKILFALAETYHNEKGLTLPSVAAPFDVYLLQVPGKTLDTRPAAEELYQKLTASGLSVFFDDRDERAGVKFNDADLLGCPVRVTVGERGLQNGMVELKKRTAAENQTVALAEAAAKNKALF